MTELRASQEVDASPERASAVILSAVALPKWFAGVHRVEADPGWPAVGSRMSWWLGPGDRWVFRAQVRENRLPDSLIMEVVTPSGESSITHRFERLLSGRTRYEKIVAPRFRGLNRTFGFLLSFIVARAMRREVARAAALLGES